MLSLITISNHQIKSVDGLFSLNDLHKAAGGEPKHRPPLFLENQQTKDLISEIQNAGIPAFKSTRGAKGGTYACKELVIAYAAWINAAFHLKVIGVFLNAAATAPALPNVMPKDMLGEISQRMNERFPDGKHRPYAWSRFNNHFGLASYKDLPAHKFDEAKAYIAQMPTNDECRAIMQSKPTDTITIPRSTWGMITDTLTMLQRATANS